jgi:cold shock CspA family protein
MATGTVQGIFSDRGFTFVQPDVDEGVSGDVFLHIRQIRAGCCRRRSLNTRRQRSVFTVRRRFLRVLSGSAVHR